MTVPALPCGCEVEANLFKTKSGGDVLILMPPQEIPVGADVEVLRGSVWCTDFRHGWVKLTAERYAELVAFNKAAS